LAAMQPFVQIVDDPSLTPHVFRAFKYVQADDPCWHSIVKGCLTAWRITADVFYDKLPTTGFQKCGLDKILNQYGQARLPSTPPEDANVTRCPCITDLTEVIAVEAIPNCLRPVKFPWLRVLHKERVPLQHHGIDMLGYILDTGGYILCVVEVMASVESAHPPSTVSQHKDQLLNDTLNQPGAMRLLEDLQTVHDEAANDADKGILNGFVVALVTGKLVADRSVIALPVLVRRNSEFSTSDWNPFLANTAAFEQAKIPSTVHFLALEVHDAFAGLIDLVKKTAAPASGAPTKTV